MIKAIEISVLRVSSNGKHIEFIINCPDCYYFTDFTIQAVDSEDVYSLKDCLFKCDETAEDAILNEDGNYYHNKQAYNGRFEVSDLGQNKPNIYEVKLIASPNTVDEECVGCCSEYPLEDTAYISDVSNVYDCLFDDILAMRDSGECGCVNDDKMDRVIRNYLILYAHQESLHLKRLDEAKRYFRMMQNCFNGCSATSKRMITSCTTCNGGTLIESVRYDNNKPSCGCKR